MKSTRTMIAALVALAGSCAGQTCDWNTGTGNWSNPANWNPQDVPDQGGEIARIGIGGVYTVTLDMSPTIWSAEITNPDATLHLPSVTLTLLDSAGLTNWGTVRGYSDGSIVGNITNHGMFTVRGYNQALYLHGPTVMNHGEFVVNPEHNGYYGDLRFVADTTLQGTGLVRLDWSSAYLSTPAGVTLTQQPGHAIRGRGRLRAHLVNNGVVEADVAGEVMILNTDPKVNNASMRATGGAILLVESVAIDQAGGGTLLAEDGSVVRLTTATIVGGSLDSVGSGYVEHRDGNSTLRGVTNLGRFNLIGYNLYTYIDGAGLTNDGTVSVNSNQYGYFASVYYTESGALDGTGTMTLNHSNAHLDSGNGVTVTHAAGHTIDGQGRILAGLANAGMVDANVPGTELVADSHAKTNTSTMGASDGGTLRVRGTTIDQSGGGVLIAGDASAVVLENCLIVGGTLESVGSGAVVHRDGNSTLRGVTNLGQLNLIGYNLYTYIDGAGLTNDGNVLVNSNQYGYFARVYYTESGALDGTGTMTLNHSNAYLESADGVTVTHTAGHTIDGQGHISAGLANAGIVDANVPGKELVADSRAKTNASTMGASSGGTLRIQATTIDQTGGGVLTAADASAVLLDGCVIVGGTLKSVGSGVVVHRDGNSTLRGVTNLGLLNLHGYNLYTYVDGGGLTNNGEIVVNYNGSGYYARLYFPQSGGLDGTGVLKLHGPVSASYLETAADATCTIGADQSVTGIGTMNGRFVSHGTLAPGLPVGTLVAQGSLVMHDDADLEIQLGVGSGYDRLDGSAAITVNGTVGVEFVEGYQPGFGHQFTIVRGQSVDGEFDAVVGASLPGELVYKVRYEPASAVLVVTCPADMNADTQISTLDFLWFLNAWSARDPEADWNGDGVVNTLDFLAYLNEWSVGCA